MYRHEVCSLALSNDAKFRVLEPKWECKSGNLGIVQNFCDRKRYKNQEILNFRARTGTDEVSERILLSRFINEV